MATRFCEVLMPVRWHSGANNRQKLTLVSDPLKVATKKKVKKKAKKKKSRAKRARSKIAANGMGSRGWGKCGAKGRSMGNGNYCTR